MSFDISIRLPPCPACGDGLRWVFDQNITHNVNEIVERSMVAAGDPPLGKDPTRGYCARAWGRLNGWKCEDVLSFLVRTHAAMTDPGRQEELRAEEPANGWGSLAGTVKVLEGVIAACKENPGGVIEAHG